MCCFFGLRHFVAELLSAENVEVQVLYGLTSVFTDVADDSVTVNKAELICDFGNNGENVCDNIGVIFAYLVYGGYMRFRNYKAVYGCLRSDVEECLRGYLR